MVENHSLGKASSGRPIRAKTQSTQSVCFLYTRRVPHLGFLRLVSWLSAACLLAFCGLSLGFLRLATRLSAACHSAFSACLLAFSDCSPLLGTLSIQHLDPRLPVQLCQQLQVVFRRQLRRFLSTQVDNRLIKDPDFSPGTLPAKDSTLKAHYCSPGVSRKARV